MDYGQSFAISAAGMAVERARVDVAAMNLANANTVAGADGKTFQPMRVVAQPVAFDRLLGEEAARQHAEASLAYEPVDVKPRMVYEPGHPMADDRGFVAFAGVDTATEMVTLMSATRAYEANVAAMNTSKALALKTLEIGGPA